MRSPAAEASECFCNAGLPVSTLYKEWTCLWVSAAISVDFRGQGIAGTAGWWKEGHFMISSVSSHSIHWLFRDAAHGRSRCCPQPQTHWWNSIICVWRPACISTFLLSYMEAPCSLILTYLLHFVFYKTKDRVVSGFIDFIHLFSKAKIKKNLPSRVHKYPSNIVLGA